MLSISLNIIFPLKLTHIFFQQPVPNDLTISLVHLNRGMAKHIGYTFDGHIIGKSNRGGKRMPG